MARLDAPRLMVIGSINIDLVADVERLPREGETVAARGFQQHLGGKGANQAAAAALAGAQVKMVGCVGDDGFGRQCLEGLERAGVDCSLVRTAPGTPTGTALITVGRRGENTIVVVPGANGALAAADVERVAAAMADADAVLVQFEVADEVVLAAARAVDGLRTGGRSEKPLFVVNPSPFRPSAVPPDGLADMFVVNEVEARQMTGVDVSDPQSAAEAARALLRRVRPGGCVVVTLGEQGAVALAGGGEPPLYVPALKVQAVDTTGAGDTFMGCLLAELCAGRRLAEALRFATAAAAISVTRPGAQSSFPRRAEVEARLAEVPAAQPLSG
ncbi:MAG: ribokinase [Limnochordales bacterium]|nr:ribokinase [Bacillota bacterium]